MSLRKAINEKCKDCIYDPESGLGSWRQQVDACGQVRCPLHPVRPRSSSPKLFYQLAQEIEGEGDE